MDRGLEHLGIIVIRRRKSECIWSAESNGNFIFSYIKPMKSELIPLSYNLHLPHNIAIHSAARTSIIQSQHLPHLPPLLLLHCILNIYPHTPRNLLPPPRHSPTPLPLPLDLLPLLFRNSSRLTRLQALEPGTDLRLFGLERLHFGNEIDSAEF
jgi:hypothetical protein